MFDWIKNMWHEVYLYFYPEDREIREALLNFERDLGEEWSESDEEMKEEGAHILTDQEIDHLCAKHRGLKVENQASNQPMFRRTCYNSLVVSSENDIS